MSKRRWAHALAIALVFWFLSVHRPEPGAARPPDDPAPAPRDPIPLVIEQAELGRKALKMMDRAIVLGLGATIGDPGYERYLWSRRLLDAELVLATAGPEPRAGRLAAYRAHFERMKWWEDRMRPLLKSRKISPLDFMEPEFFRVEAETWLAMEEVRQADAAAQDGAPRKPK